MGVGAQPFVDSTSSTTWPSGPSGQFIGRNLLAAANKLATLSPAIHLFQKIGRIGRKVGQLAGFSGAKNAP